MPNIEFGLNINTRVPLIYPESYTTDNLLDFANECEEIGYSSVWVGDSILAKKRIDPLVTLGAVAVRTSRVKLGACCLIAPLRNPVLLARSWASLDIISHGRTMLGVCIGPTRDEYNKIGLYPKNRTEMLDECMSIVQRLWTEESVSHAGRYYKLDRVALEPKPLQRPRPPLYMVGWPYGDGKEIDKDKVESTLSRVARLSDGWMLDGGATPALVGQGVQRIRNMASSFGRRASDLEVIYQPTLNIDPDPRKARAQANEYIQKYYGTLKREISVFGVGGTADDAIKLLQDYITAGVTTFVLRFASPNQFAQLERFTSQVLPSFSR